MLTATAAFLYSTSPPTVPSSNASNSSHPASPSCPIEIGFHIRNHSSFHPNTHASKPVIGGLSSLFTSPPSRHGPSSASSDATAIEGSSLLSRRRLSHNDLSSLVCSSDKEADFGASAKSKETIATSSLHKPSSLCSNQTRPFIGKVTKSSGEQNEIVASNNGLDDFHLREEGLDTWPATPRLTKMTCSSLPDFFCKPLFPDVLVRSREMLRKLQKKHDIFNDGLIIQAFKEADQAHSGQLRANGDPYIVHCVETALILAEIGSSKVVVAAGLLHDTIDDSSIDDSQLEEHFGLEITDLIKGVSKLSELSKLARDNNTAYKSIEADRLHTMMLAMTDVRVVLIKLADRLHNMRTLGALPNDKRKRIAKETLEVFVPIAGRLGIWSWKAELEDLCFKFLDHDNHRKLSRKLAEGFREKIILSAIHTLDDALLARKVQYLDLSGRPKNLYSIHKKMLRKGRKVEEIYDAQGLRLIVSDVTNCYTALEVVHEIWSCVPGKQKDYIHQPKWNGYQSLHTVVWGEDGLPLEIQIRTMEMHHQAEFGVAAHWRYKEGDALYSSFVLQTVEWARWVLTWQNEIVDRKLRLFTEEMDTRPSCSFPFHKEDCQYLDISCSPHRDDHSPLLVIVLQEEKMMVQELPGNSTVADLLERISKGYMMGVDEGKTFVNHTEIEDIYQKLQMGDLVEVIPENCLAEYRDKLMQMYDNFSAEDLKMEPERSAIRLSKVAVF